MKRFSAATSRSIVRWKVSRDSASMSSRASSRALLPRFWIGCDRSWNSPAAIRPNIAWRSCRLTFSCSSTSRSAIVLKARPRSANSLPPRTCTRVSRSPAAMPCVARCSVKIGAMKRRPNTRPTATITMSAAPAAMYSDPCSRRAFAYASLVGCSTISVQPSGSILAATARSSISLSSMNCRQAGSGAPISGWLLILSAWATSAFLSGSPCAIRVAVGRRDQREPALPDPDADRPRATSPRGSIHRPASRTAG